MTVHMLRMQELSAAIHHPLGVSRSYATWGIQANFGGLAWGVHDFSHAEDTGVICSDTPPSGGKIIVSDPYYKTILKIG